jgi:hypothetical protein
VLKANSEYKAGGKDVERGPWPQEWVASGPDSTVEVEEIEEVGEVPASGAAVEDGEGDELEEEDAGEGQDSATGEGRRACTDECSDPPLTIIHSVMKDGVVWWFRQVRW